MASAIADGDEDFAMTILYGSRTAGGILLKDEIEQIAARSGGRVKVVHILSDEEAEGFEHGFITAELIKKYAPEEDFSIFMCGPKAMSTQQSNAAVNFFISLPPKSCFTQTFAEIHRLSGRHRP